MRLAHLILTHANPQQLSRLINSLQHVDADIYIQLDEKTLMAGFVHLKKIKGVQFIQNRVKVYWGNYSIIQATLNGFEEILNTGISYSHINLLSGQDYPLKSASDIQSFLFSNADKTFMHSLSIENEWTEAQPRIYKYHFGDFMFPGRYRLQAIVNFFMPARKMPAGMLPYGRSQWFTITPECARYIITFLKENSTIRKYFRMTWAPDEFIFQTLLYNSPYRNSVVNDNLRHIDFSQGGYHPKTLQTTDYNTLVNSGKFYARKFDLDSSAELLAKLDEVILRLEIINT